MNPEFREKVSGLKEVLRLIWSKGEEYLRLLDLERTLILTHDLMAYRGLLEKKESLGDLIGRLEEKRKDIIHEISKITEIPVSELHSRRLLELLDREERDEMEFLITSIKATASRIKDLDEQLSIKIKRISYVISLLFERLRENLRPQEYFYPQSRVQAIGTPGLFLSQKA
ncbi:MAG: hypothetical protein ACK4WB_00345 [Desulfatiglandales bacterium]